MTYWALEFKYIENPELGWVPWAVLGDGTLDQHLKITKRVPEVEISIEDARIRPIDEEEALRLSQRGIQLWTKK